MAKQAIGILETKGFIALIEGADAALKSADIQMTGWDKIGSGLVTGFFTGNVAAVKAGLDAAALDATVRDHNEALAAEIAKNTRALVKKQRTWFRNQLPPHCVVDVATLTDERGLFGDAG